MERPDNPVRSIGRLECAHPVCPVHRAVCGDILWRGDASFTSGILWGFAARARDGKASLGYVLAVLPAVWAFAMTGGGARSAALNLSIGFLASLVLDALFTRYRLTPDWWMSLRLPLTLATVTCLLITAAL
ncbi:DUF3429 domain-containing protein [Thalassovita litoralis]